METTGLRREDAERLLDRDLAAKRNPLLEAQWVANLHVVCEAMRGGTADPLGLFISVFWIRLYGVLVDLRNRFSRSADAHKDAVGAGIDNPFSAGCAAIYEACDAIYQALSDDELTYAVFIRHTEAHVYQHSFDFSVERGNPAHGQPAALRTKQMVPTLRKHIDVDQVHQIVDNILQKAGGEESRVAVNLAHRLGPHIERLNEAMTHLEGEREKDRIASDARRPLVERSWPTKR